jgi:hypothetical protein
VIFLARFIQNPLLRGVSVRVRPQVPLFKAPFLIERGFLMLLIY